MPSKRTRQRLAAMCALALGWLAAQRLAAQDATDSRDHPLLARVSGYRIAAYREKGAEDATFCVRTSRSRAKVKGRYWRFTYRRASGGQATTADQIRSHYRDLFKKARAAPVCESAPDLDARIVRDGVETWVHLRAFTPGDTYELEVVETAAR